MKSAALGARQLPSVLNSVPSAQARAAPGLDTAPPRFNLSTPAMANTHLAILAPGLLGASIARAARARRVADQITVWSRRPETRAELAGQAWLDHVAATPEQAVARASLVVLAAPVDKIIELDRQIAPHLAPHAIVTDVGSVKGPICAAATCHASLRPAGAVFIGSHPMAGSEKTGWQHGSAELFTGRVCFVTPDPSAPPDAVQSLASFWRDLGSTVVTTQPEKHDEIVAHLSHLPQAVATSLACALAAKDGQWRHLAGNGLRDTTRIAASDATMWVEIFQHNREPVLHALTAFENSLADLRRAIEQRDWNTVRTKLETGKLWRDGFQPKP